MNQARLLTLAKICFWIAAGIAGYLTSVTLLSESIPGCGSGSACDSVLHGTWSHVAGIPVALLGLVIYLVGLAMAEEYAVGTARERWAIFTAQVCYGSIVLAAVWFLVVQKFIIGQFCIWCTSAHVVALVGIGILVYLRRKCHKAGEAEKQPEGQYFLANNAVRAGLLGMCLAVASVALTQGPLLVKPPSVVAQSHQGSLLTAGGTTPLLSMLNGKYEFDTKKLKHYGNPSSEHISVALVDFTCDFCRRYHRVLKEVAGQDGLIYLLPACHTPEGAELHKLMLVALWQDEAKYDEVAEKIYSGAIVPQLPAVKKALIEAFGEPVIAKAFERDVALATKFVDQARGVWEANKLIANSDRLPQLMRGEQVLVGYYESPKQVVDFLKKSESTVAAPAATPVLVKTEPTVSGTPQSSKPESVLLPPPLLANHYLELGVQTSGAVVPVQVVLRNPRTTAFKISWFNLDAGLSLAQGLNMEIPGLASGGIPLQLKIPDQAGGFERQLRVMNAEGKETLTVVVRGTSAAATASK